MASLLTAHSCVFPSSLIHAASLLNSLATERCPFLSQLRSKTTIALNRTCSQLACVAPQGTYSRSSCLFPTPTTPRWLIITRSLLPLSDYVYLTSCRVTLCCAGSSSQSSPECGGCRVPGSVLNSPRLATGGARPQQSSPLCRHLNWLFFVPTEEVFVKQSSFTTTVFVTLLQLNTPHGNLSVQCHLLLASRATGVVTSTIWNVSCLVHSQSRFLVKCCYLIFTLPDRSTLDHLKTPRELAWAHLIQCLWYWFQWALMTYQMFLLMDEILIKL